MDLNSNLEKDLFEHYQFIADKGQEPLRVDKFLMNRIENSTRNKIQISVWIVKNKSFTIKSTRIFKSSSD